MKSASSEDFKTVLAFDILPTQAYTYVTDNAYIRLTLQTHLDEELFRQNVLEELHITIIR